MQDEARVTQPTVQQKGILGYVTCLLHTHVCLQVRGQHPCDMGWPPHPRRFLHALHYVPRYRNTKETGHGHGCDPGYGLPYKLPVELLETELPGCKASGGEDLPPRASLAAHLRSGGATEPAIHPLATGGGDQRPSALKAGTRLYREWHGVNHEVLVTDEGCRWRGRDYQSLSEVARAITGTRWSGPRFFGLRQ